MGNWELGMGNWELGINCFLGLSAVNSPKINSQSPIPDQTTNDKQQTTNNKQQTTNNKQQTTNQLSFLNR
ncbi:MAG: hypothetical protein F6K47_40580 [Symploca sp. SIO2E6]|nr:hypothetical protein [Symploca sp. SIO2E6]